MSKILVVGAGFSGAVIARELAEAGHNVTIIDKRYHIAGNAYDFVNDHKIRMHAYGPHLFHTNNKKVYDYLGRFTEWIPYKHKVKALLSNGDYVTLPVNRATKDIVGEDNIVDIFIRPYTKKMWGMDIEELDPSIINRVPIRNDFNEYYFPDDEYQAIPRDGYTALISNMLDWEGITVSLGTSFDRSMEKDYDHIFNSMPIDVYHDYCHGELPYRSIKFHHVDIPAPRILPTATVNFTHHGPYTRMTEWKNIPNHGHNPEMTTLTYEEPCDYRTNNMERYYPVKDLSGTNREIYKLYAAIKHPKMTFIGRCGMYVYIDIHQAVSSALSVAHNYLKKVIDHEQVSV
ncbi:FAD-dependent oxidoreductase [uncultured phage]|nr:FAD-dependent oxidoreductase [uncultured phage]